MIENSKNNKFLFNVKLKTKQSKKFLYNPQPRDVDGDKHRVNDSLKYDPNSLKLVFDKGDLVMYDNGFGKVEPGIFKRYANKLNAKKMSFNGIDDKRAFIWFHSGCTAAGCKVQCLRRLTDLEKITHKHLFDDIHSGCVECLPKTSFPNERIVIRKDVR